MATIDNLEIQITTSADEAVRALQRLTSASGQLRGAANSAAGGTENLVSAAYDAGMKMHDSGEEAKTAGPKIRTMGKDMEEAGKSAKKGTSGISTFWNALKRIAFYRFARTVIKEITDAFKEGIKNLYHWSDAVNGHFAKSMDRLATSTQYLKNSLGAMVSPLIESFIPVLDTIIDKLVVGLNYVNMFFSALSGSDTYTVAKKAAAVWDESAKSTKKTVTELKRTILGFDEINKLDKPTTHTTGTTGKKQPNYAAMFEEKPLEGFWKKISNVTKNMPDWLKWLLGGAALVGGFLLIKKFIPWLLKKLGTLFTMKIPEWLKWLFGPKGNGNNGTNIPDKIDLPDTTLPVKIDPSPDSIVDKFTNLWKSKDRSLPFTGYISSGAFVVFNRFLALWEAANRALPMTAYITTSALALYKLFLERWEATNKVLPFTAYITTTPYTLYKIFDDRWEASDKRLAFTSYIQTSTDSMYKNVKNIWDSSNKTLKFTAYIVANISFMYNLIKERWLENDKSLPFTGYMSADTERMYKTVKDRWNASNKTLPFTGYITTRAKDLFDSFAEKWETAKKKLSISAKIVPLASALFNDFKKKWDATKTPVVVMVRLQKDGWTTITNLLDQSFSVDTNTGFGGATGGGGGTKGGGAGRGRHGTSPNGYSVDVKVNSPTNNDVKSFWDTLETLWNGYTWLMKKELKVGVSAYTAWEKSGGILSYLGLTNLNTNINFGAKTAWGWKNPIDWLGLGNLATSIKVSLKATTKELKLSSGGGGTWKLYTKAKGGIFSNGVWSDIPQYAGGKYGVNHGTMFWAGENGAEIVGNSGGRTEVLNKSQIASSIFSAVRAAMAPAASNFADAAQMMAGGNDDESIDMLLELVRRGSEATERQNDLLRQQNDYLRQINDKDFNAEITTSAINSAQTRANRRSGVTVVPVGI